MDLKAGAARPGVWKNDPSSSFRRAACRGVPENEDRRPGPCEQGGGLCGFQSDPFTGLIPAMSARTFME